MLPHGNLPINNFYIFIYLYGPMLKILLILEWFLNEEIWSYKWKIESFIHLQKRYDFMIQNKEFLLTQHIKDYYTLRYK